LNCQKKDKSGTQTMISKVRQSEVTIHCIVAVKNLGWDFSLLENKLTSS